MTLKFCLKHNLRFLDECRYCKEEKEEGEKAKKTLKLVKDHFENEPIMLRNEWEEILQKQRYKDEES